MTEFQDRIKASTDRVPHPTHDKEAFTVLALNDAAARSRRGRFYYLPESREPPRILGNQHQPVVMKSIVPRLLYANYEWKTSEEEKYVKMNDNDRHNHVQRNIGEELYQVDVIPINLVISPSGIPSLSWPVDSQASVVIYGPGPWYKLSWMSDWTQKATKIEAGNTYQASMYRTSSPGKNKARYMQSVNCVGKICGAEQLPLILRAMLRLSVDEVEGTGSGAPEIRAIAQQVAATEGSERTWIAGVKVLEELALEATKRGEKGGFSNT